MARDHLRSTGLCRFNHFAELVFRFLKLPGAHIQTLCYFG